MGSGQSKSPVAQPPLDWSKGMESLNLKVKDCISGAC